MFVNVSSVTLPNTSCSSIAASMPFRKPMPIRWNCVSCAFGTISSQSIPPFSPASRSV
ncbi:Uncharacterised protein [Burkholderia pseudomallei]|nr:Uncharacterised protein [Burkholderia pseudomallei]